MFLRFRSLFLITIYFTNNVTALLVPSGISSEKSFASPSKPSLTIVPNTLIASSSIPTLETLSKHSPSTPIQSLPAGVGAPPVSSTLSNAVVSSVPPRPNQRPSSDVLSAQQSEPRISGVGAPSNQNPNAAIHLNGASGGNPRPTDTAITTAGTPPKAAAPVPAAGVASSDCLHCLVGPGVHSSAAALAPSQAALGRPDPTAEPVVEGQSPAAPNAKATNAPFVNHISQLGNPASTPLIQTPQNVVNDPIQATPQSAVNDPIQAVPQQTNGVPTNPGSSPAPSPAPIPAPPPAAITLKPQTTGPPQAVVSQNNPSIGQVINGALNNQPGNAPVESGTPEKNANPTGTVPLVAVVPSVNVGGQPVVQHPNSNIVVAGSTIPPGATGQVAGHSIVNGVNSIVVDGNSQPLPTPVAPPSINGQPIQSDQKGNLVIAGSTVAPGSHAVIQGHTLDNQGANYVLDGSTGSSQPSTGPPALPIVENQPIQKQQNGNVVIGGSITVAPGAQTNIAGQHISNGPSQVEVNGQTFAAAPTQSPAPPLTDGDMLHLTNGILAVGTQTLAPGSQVTLSGQVVNYQNPSQILINGITHNLAAVSSVQPLVVAGQTLDRASNGGVVIAGSTIAPGGVGTFSGHVFSLAGSSSIIEDGQTYSIPATNNAYIIAPASETNLPVETMPSASAAVYTVGGQTFSANPTGFEIGTKTIRPGGLAVDISGTMISLDKSNHLQIGTSTMDLSSEYAVPTNDVVSIGGIAVTAVPTGFVVNGSSVSPGGSAVTVDGIVVSLDKQSHLKIGSSTMLLTNFASVTTTASEPSVGAPTPAGSAGSPNAMPTSPGTMHSGATRLLKDPLGFILWLLIIGSNALLV